MAKHKTISTYKLGEKVPRLLHDEPGGDGDGLHAAVPLQQEPVLHVAQLHELALLAEGAGAAMCRMLDNVSSSASKISIRRLVITEKAPTRDPISR